MPGTNCFEGYYGNHGLFQACINFFERQAPNASAPASTNEDDDPEFQLNENSDDAEEKEAVENLHEGLKATQIQVYDMANDEEYQSAVNEAIQTFTQEEELEVDSDSKVQEEPTKEQSDPVDYELPGIKIRIRDPPPKETTPSGSGRKRKPEDSPPTGSSLHHPDNEPSVPVDDQPFPVDYQPTLVSGDEDETTIPFNTWREEHHLIWFPREKGAYPGWDDYKVTTCYKNWPSLKSLQKTDVPWHNTAFTTNTHQTSIQRNSHKR